MYMSSPPMCVCDPPYMCGSLIVIATYVVGRWILPRLVMNSVTMGVDVG